MTIRALVSGTIFHTPESRTAKSGKQFTTATLKVHDGDAAQWVRLTAFNETAQGELLRLNDGDALSAQGPLKAETYIAADGSTKLSLSIVADQILALKQPPKNAEKSWRPHARRVPESRALQQVAAHAGFSERSDEGNTSKNPDLRSLVQPRSALHFCERPMRPFCLP